MFRTNKCFNYSECEQYFFHHVLRDYDNGFGDDDYDDCDDDEKCTLSN